MKNLIKKYIGITGFIIALMGVLISAYHKFYYNDAFDTIGELSLLLWISTLTISNELNKSNPKQWYISCISCVYNILCFLDSLLKPNKTNKKPIYKVQIVFQTRISPVLHLEVIYRTHPLYALP